jgi:hypothetical protein
VISWSAGPVLSAQTPPKFPDGPVSSRRWPCRLVVKPTLAGVVADGLERSLTLQRQCDALAEGRAVVVLQWGKTDSQSRALAQMELRDGVVVAWIHIPPVPEAVEHVGHELQHVLEMVRGVDFDAEAKRPGSGVWRAFGGFETKAAVDAGRRVARELRDFKRP